MYSSKKAGSEGKLAREAMITEVVMVLQRAQQFTEAAMADENSKQKPPLNGARVVRKCIDIIAPSRSYYIYGKCAYARRRDIECSMWSKRFRGDNRTVRHQRRSFEVYIYS